MLFYFCFETRSLLCSPGCPEAQSPSFLPRRLDNRHELSHLAHMVCCFCFHWYFWEHKAHQHLLFNLTVARSFYSWETQALGLKTTSQCQNWHGTSAYKNGLCIVSQSLAACPQHVTSLFYIGAMASHTNTAIPRGGWSCWKPVAAGKCSEVFQGLPNQTKEEVTHSLLMNMNFRVEKNVWTNNLNVSFFPPTEG